MFESFQPPLAPPLRNSGGMYTNVPCVTGNPLPVSAGNGCSPVEPGRQLAARVRSFSAALAGADLLEAPDYELVDLLRVLEELKSSAAA
ncbi:hypothetical protein, partial [Arthrobacter sp. IK3]|uniref:hypothetical protein n=1 Tax=Arthrobacter sp. IK3 TaxID=3448169 RepID=UPI003EE3A918